ncbi:site-specific DNA-methyltransferase [Pseudoxanthomonas kalamensis DSM 18571]|uniref:site-specific DNA-methyltransferase n=1 Tax=Pseudoxanthomonas kalamensis TaxID=289483 RepID=UPI0013912BF6|nr:site-specific DNA-methyltransferase [Pseudoxanthomonas kalamensis]KAF1712235.1 site-specific DNA-methyltransferase [Pseudoxanthomonas kalamensis DSM 18571]
MHKITATDPEAQSADLVAGNIAQLKALFPELITEGAEGAAINVDVLKQLVGDATVSDAEEKYGLNWHGKRRARQLALTPSTGTLRPCPEDSVDWDTTQNLIIEGDNLEVLKLLQKSYAGKVKLIYIDPPYNTGNDFIYPDSFQDSIKNYLEVTGQVEDGRKISSNTEASGRFHTDWLNMMYPRLKLARNLLREDGAVFVNIDFNEAENLKKVLDEIFGEENFQRAVVWRIGWLSGYKTMANNFIRNHDSILFYSRNTDQLDFIKRYIENENFKPLIKKDKKLTEKLDELGLSNEQQSELLRFVNHENRPDRYPIEDTWNSNEYDDLNSIAIVSFSGEKISKVLGIDEEFKGQKSVKMLMRIIESIAKDDDLVMDFFGGTGSTAHATMQLNASDKNARRFIIVQLPEAMSEESEAFKAGYKTISDIGKERLRRVGAKLKAEAGLSTLDTGFRVYKLDQSNIRAWQPSGNLERDLVDAVEHIAPGRSEQDVLTELLLKLGLDLCVPIEQRQIAGKTVHAIGGGVLMACLALRIGKADAEPLALGIAEWHASLAPAGDTTCVFRDSAFENDEAKTNLAAILEQHGVHHVRSL